MIDWTSLPDQVFVRLLENCNFEAILNLRKVCTHFRNLIDDTPPPLKTSLDWLVLNVNPESVKITLTNVGSLFHEQCAIDYLKSEEGCLVAWKEHWQWRTKPAGGERWITVALRDLEIYMRLLGRSILPHLSIHYYFVPEENEFQEGFHRILETHSLRVEDLDLNISNTEQLLQILPNMTPGVLRQVTVAKQQMTEFQVDPVLDMDKVMALEQVRKLEELRIRGFEVSKPIREFYYPSRVVLQVKQVTLKDIWEMRRVQ
ncbi:hypothetical protein GCK72_021387 [Caenorhabditis remanei]|uniref:F-box domain-containing protein n=1 Tax=Caenorhabditis remanei TaxID=31234 RepID=A0A6A5GJF4_CAERE|nr:hypothetical protein GCK72_021387 [Caenorhabditis remanei]KAF1754823.1 hypothetical protein GCK72_021387 [Caenorhabditis remanei]